MAERLDLIKDVFNKAEYIKTIDTSFNELGASTIVEEEQTQPTVEEFFGLYNSLFYDIPALGETNSHDYIVKTSGEYINFEENNVEIQALQAEIAQLRTDLLNAQMQLIQSEAGQSDNPEANAELQKIAEELEAANQALVETNTNIEQQQSTTNNVGSISGASSGAGSGASTTAAAVSSGGGGGGY